MRNDLSTTRAHLAALLDDLHTLDDELPEPWTLDVAITELEATIEALDRLPEVHR